MERQSGVPDTSCRKPASWATPDGTLLLTVRDRVGAEGRAIVSLHGLTFTVPLAPVRR